MKEETALRKVRKKQYAVMYMYMYMYMYKLYKDAHNRIYTQTPTGYMYNVQCIIPAGDFQWH